MPLLQKGEVKGALYLENNIIIGAFYGAAISVESKVAQGTSFSVAFPRAGWKRRAA
jgi:hypothetical protein